MKTYALGRDINDFYNNHFPEGCYCDDMSPFIQNNDNYWTKDEKLSLVATVEYNLDDFGVIIKDTSDLGRPVEWDFSEKFLEWQDKQNFATFAVKVPRGLESIVKERIAAIDPTIEILEG